jgi:hypothetical protein
VKYISVWYIFDVIKGTVVFSHYALWIAIQQDIEPETVDLAVRSL